MDSFIQKTEDYKPAMGKRLRECRLRSNLTQENMAEFLNISVKHYSEVERGITGLSVEKLIYLSNIFGVSLDYLLKGETEKDLVPLLMTEIYKSCPDKKKVHLLELLKCLNQLMQHS